MVHVNGRGSLTMPTNSDLSGADLAAGNRSDPLAAT